MKNIYWHKSGKYQEKYDELEKVIPDIGYTSNKYVNLLITASSLYYDVYNNGGCNVEDCYLEDIDTYIVPFSSNISSINFMCSKRTIVANLCNKEKLENFINEVIELLDGKDLDYGKYIIYQNYDKEESSKEQKDGFDAIVFGNENEESSLVKDRINTLKFKLI